MTSPAERRTIARIAANYRWAREPDRVAATAEMRRRSPASLDYWLRRVDPDMTMSHAERVKRAENAKAAYYGALALKMRQAKAAKRR